MLEDVKKALSAVRAKSGPGCQPLVVDTRTGATALHVAAAKVSNQSGKLSCVDVAYITFYDSRKSAKFSFEKRVTFNLLFSN